MPSSTESITGSRTGKVVSVNTSEKKTVRKKPGTTGTLVFDRGFEGDAHAGDWHRQVSLLALESIQTMVDKGLDVGPGDFAENITTEGIDLCSLPIGTKIRIGDTLVELSQIGKICHTKCAIYYQAGRLRHASGRHLRGGPRGGTCQRRRHYRGRRDGRRHLRPRSRGRARPSAGLVLVRRRSEHRPNEHGPNGLLALDRNEE